MDSIRLSKDHYEKMVNLTPELLCITDLDGRFRYINPAFEKVLGYSSEEIIGLTLYVLLCAKDVLEIKNTIQTMNDEKNEFTSFEMSSRCKNGSYKWLSWNTRVDWTEGLVYSAGRDVTEKNQMEKECLQIRQRLLEAQKFAHLGYWDLDIISGELYWSDEFFSILGYKQQEFIPTLNDFMERVHPDDKESVTKVIVGPFTASECELDFRIIRQESEITWIHEKIRYEYDSSGKRVRKYGIIQDITQRKLGEIRLKESEEKFKELAENLGEVVWISQDGLFDYISSAYEKVTGRTCQSLYDNPQSYLDSIHPDDQARIIKSLLEDKCTSKGLFDEQYRINRLDGTIRWVWAKTFPIYNENEEIVRKVGIAEDITEIKEYEESLRLAMEKAEAANKAKSQFLANMSHEIRTPMSGVLGMAQLLIMDLNGKQKEMAQIIKTCGDNLLNIINDILDLSRVEAGKFDFFPEEFNLKSVVDEVNKVIQPLVFSRGLEYSFHVDKEMNGQLLGDVGRLKQILFNLLGNAIKFTESGRIELSIVKGKAYRDSVQLVFSIKDTGVGIADDKIGDLFTYFTQGDDSVTKRYGGTGLGLAISKHLINMMDGEITVESKLGVGSTFSFNAIFKVAMNDTEINKANNEDALNVNITYLTALLVEDNYVSGVVMKKLCERKNIALTIATNGKQAIEIMKNESFDMIFMDIQIPEISGYETAKIIRDMEKNLDRHTPIIATTAFALVGDREKCLDAGMDDYLSKPIDAEKFYAVVEKWVKARV